MPMPHSLTHSLRRRRRPAPAPLSLLALLAGAFAAVTIGLAASGARAAAGAHGSRPALGAAATAPLHLTPLLPGSAAGALSAHRAGRAPAAASVLGPAQLRSSYSLPAFGARAQKIAVVSAYNDPHAQADLNAYTSRYRIRPCTSANHCFEVLNEKGRRSPLPGPDPTGGTWVSESAIGTQTARGLCQSCSIMLVEASSSGRGDLSAAVNAAARAGATVIVTTFGFVEDPAFDPGYAQDYSHAHAIVVSASGDAQGGEYGYSGEAEFPSALPNVLAVGGTQLDFAGGRYRSESVWPGTVSGCSLYEPASTWQAHDAAAVGCQTRRAVADLAAMASPGVPVHITGTGVPGGPWYEASGTSVSAPIIAAVIGLAGSLGAREGSTLYSRALSDPSALRNITTGENAPDCTSAICRGQHGYNGPSGLGTPYGLAAFLPSGGALARRNPRVTLTVASGGLHPGRSWSVFASLHNANPFAVTGILTLRRTLRIGGHLRTVFFAQSPVRVPPLAGSRVRLLIRSRWRGLLRARRHLQVYLFLRVHGPVRPTLLVTRTTSLAAL